MKLASVSKYEPSFRDLAEDVLRLQMEGWLARKYMPVQMFALLMQGRSLDNFLTGRNLHFWTKYLDAFNAKFPSLKMNRIDVLRTTYDNNDQVIFSALELAKKDPQMKNLATEWQNQQIESWAENSDVFSPHVVFRLLNLHVTGLDGRLASPYLRTWTQYMEKVSKGGEMIDEFLAYFKVPLLSKVFEEARGEQETNQLATRLQEQLLARLEATAGKVL